MKRNLGTLETQFFAYVQMRKLKTVRAGELVTSVLGLAPEQERKLLSRLSRGGLIARVRQGLYLVPSALPLGGAWTPSEAMALNALMEDAKGQYQICGPNTFNKYGFDEQIPKRIYAYNNRLFGDYTIGAVAATLIKVADARLGDTTEVVFYDGEKAIYASRVRTLVDAVYDWSRFNSLPNAYEWIRKDLQQKRVNIEELVTVTLRYGNTGTIRRMGTLLEREGVDDAVLKRLVQALNPTRSMIPWIPNRPKRGKINRRWGVVINEPS
jgi:predicted transcriptional regulator of viral defense system